MIRQKLILAAAIAAGCAVALGASNAQTRMPDWSGQWEFVGATPDATGGLVQPLDEVLKTMQWGPPNNPVVQSGVDQIVASGRKRLEAVQHGTDPGGVLAPTCTFGFPAVMIESPLMFEVLPTPKETVLIFSGREVRHIYTDGRTHTPKDDLWATPWGDSIGHWEGQTLVIDTIAVKSPSRDVPPEMIPIFAVGGHEARMITYLSLEAHFIERIRMPDKDHLEDQMTIIDPTSLTAPWHLSRTYQRVANLHRMVYEDCEGEDRNPIVNGHYTVTPPPSSPPFAAPSAATNNAPAGQAPAPK